MNTLFLVLLAGCGQVTTDDGPQNDAHDAGVTTPDGESTDGSASAEDATPSLDVARQSDVAPSDIPAGFISEEEWRRRIEPLGGEHDVERLLSNACPAQHIGQDFRVTPTVGCHPRLGTPMVLDCDVEPVACYRHDQCQAGPFGRCRGSTTARCGYPVELDFCSADSDCTALPGGFCAPVAPYTLCYPTGRCEMQEPRCGYRDEECSIDADCATVPGGICQKRIISVRCEYTGCAVDANCGQGTRCACSTFRGSRAKACVPADCQTDGDCGAGQECRLESGCYDVAIAYHCSTPLDTCRKKEDCGDTLVDHCVYKGSWQCERRICPIID